MTVTGQDCLKTLARERFWGDLGVAPLHELAERLDRAQPHRPALNTLIDKSAEGNPTVAEMCALYTIP